MNTAKFTKLKPTQTSFLHDLFEEISVGICLTRDILSADDCALLAHTVDNIKVIANAFARSARRFELTISLKKTKRVIYQPKPGADYKAQTITVDNNPLNVTDKLTYLGSTISQNALIDEEISARIGKASGSFGKLAKHLGSERGLWLITKVNVYCADVLPTLLYGCEAWTPYHRHIRRPVPHALPKARRTY